MSHHNNKKCPTFAFICWVCCSFVRRKGLITLQVYWRVGYRHHSTAERSIFSETSQSSMLFYVSVQVLYNKACWCNCTSVVWGNLSGHIVLPVQIKIQENASLELHVLAGWNVKLGNLWIWNFLHYHLQYAIVLIRLLFINYDRNVWYKWSQNKTQSRHVFAF